MKSGGTILPGKRDPGKRDPGKPKPLHSLGTLRRTEDAARKGSRIGMVGEKKTWMAKLNNTKCVFISAQNKDNVVEFKKVLYNEVRQVFETRYPYHHFLY